MGQKSRNATKSKLAKSQQSKSKTNKTQSPKTESGKSSANKSSATKSKSNKSKSNKSKSNKSKSNKSHPNKSNLNKSKPTRSTAPRPRRAPQQENRNADEPAQPHESDPLENRKFLMLLPGYDIQFGWPFTTTSSDLIGMLIVCILIPVMTSFACSSYAT